MIDTRLWAIHPGHAIEAYSESPSDRGPTLTEWAAGPIATKYLATSWDEESQLLVSKPPTGGVIAIVPVVGTMRKRGGWFSIGTAEMASMVDRANGQADVTAIFLDMETPGGTLDGTPPLAKAVRDSKKPVVAFCDTMVCSAGMWVASQARHVMVNADNPTELGSIGVLYVYENQAKFIEKNIGSVEIIRAPQSVDKARPNSVEPLGDGDRGAILESLKQSCEYFIGELQAGRGGAVKPEALTGKTFQGTDAVAMGLADSQGTFAEALILAAELGKKQSSIKKQAKMQFPNLKTLFGADNEPPKEDAVAAQAAENKLAEMAKEKQNLKNQLAESQKSLSEYKDKAAGLKTEIDGLKSKIEALEVAAKKEPAAPTTTVSDKEDPPAGDGGEGGANEFQTSVDLELKQLKDKIHGE